MLLWVKYNADFIQSMSQSCKVAFISSVLQRNTTCLRHNNHLAQVHINI